MGLRQTTRGSLVLALLVLHGVLLASGAFAATTAKSPSRPAPQVVVKVDSGLRWLDATIGAATALAVVALIYGLVLTARQRQPRRPPGGTFSERTKGDT
ncbi:MAG: hypothetical protein QOD52_1015 [Gaiellaceae bacterium]|nr:hypothetical protein [Gaiellaceae bacterium]